MAKEKKIWEKKKTIYIYYVTKHHVDSLQGLLGESVEEDILDLKGLS